MSIAVSSDPTTQVARTYGNLTITAQRTIDGGYSLNVYAATSGHRYDNLAYSSPDWAAFMARINHIRNLAAQGLTGDQIADRINQPARQAVDDAEQIVTNALNELAAIGNHRHIRPTMAGAHLANLTAPQQRALAAQHDGIITPGPGINRSTLNALDRKGYGTVVYTGARKRISHLVLNARGLRACEGVAR